MVKLKNTILVDRQGYPIKPKEIPVLILEYDSAWFPPRQGGMSGGNGELTFSSSGPNTIYIDLGEGVPLFEQTFTKINNVSYVFETTQGIHLFPNATRRTAKMWFEHPSRIASMGTNYVYFKGEFPKELLLFNFVNLKLGRTQFESYPTVLKGGIFSLLSLNSITSNVINYLPDWITQSKITSLSLFGGLDLTNPTINNMDKLVNTKGLTTLILTVIFGPNSFPDNFKNITALRTFSLGGSNILAIPQQVTDSKQIITLGAGYGYGFASPNNFINSWGTGIGGMNITTLRFTAVYNLPTTLPTGIEECPTLKNIDTGSSYKTLTKVNAVITDAYNKVTTFASKTVGNTLLRQITWSNSITTSAFGYNNRPTGTYQQPTGFVMGSNNGSPTSPMEMIWVLVNQYKWKIIVTNTTGDGFQSYI